jgi:Protein of unknown function (DUF2794)
VRPPLAFWDIAVVADGCKALTAASPVGRSSHLQNALRPARFQPAAKLVKWTLALIPTFGEDNNKHRNLTGGPTAMDDLKPAEETPGPHPGRSRKVLLAQPTSKTGSAPGDAADVISFNRDELRKIFNLYGRKVGDGEWRDYAIDFTPQKAVFSIYRRACEYALYRIEKYPRLACKQGAYAVITATGLILKHGHDLSHVIACLDSGMRLVSG